MLVPARLESGRWVTWRVSRRRLAWRPSGWPAWFLQFADGGQLLFWVIVIPVVGYLLASWVAALLATVVVWSARAVRGRWPVEAYVVNPPDGDDRLQRVWVDGRKEADAAVRQWASDIKRYGRPRNGTDRPGIAGGGD